jgi:hypothetical protein
MAKVGKRSSTIPGRLQFAGALLAGKGDVLPVPVIIYEPPVERKHDASGRPSSKAFLEQEARRLAVAGNPKPSQRVFASRLSKWLRDTHPGLPQPKIPTITNIVRSIWQQWPETI